eukprot:1406137-Rhodomonas_salina.4
MPRLHANLCATPAPESSAHVPAGHVTAALERSAAVLLLGSGMEQRYRWALPCLRRRRRRGARCPEGRFLYQ